MLGSDGQAGGPNLPNALAALHDERLDTAVRADEEIAQLAELASALPHRPAENRAQRSRAFPVEAEILEQQEGRGELERVVPRSHGSEGEEAEALVAAEDDEPERAPLGRVEQDVHGLAEAYSVEPNRELEQLGGGPRPHSLHRFS